MQPYHPCAQGHVPLDGQHRPLHLPPTGPSVPPWGGAMAGHGLQQQSLQQQQHQHCSPAFLSQQSQGAPVQSSYHQSLGSTSMGPSMPNSLYRADYVMPYQPMQCQLGQTYSPQMAPLSPVLGHAFSPVVSPAGAALQEELLAHSGQEQPRHRLGGVDLLQEGDPDLPSGVPEVATPDSASEDGLLRGVGLGHAFSPMMAPSIASPQDLRALQGRGHSAVRGPQLISVDDQASPTGVPEVATPNSGSEDGIYGGFGMQVPDASLLQGLCHGEFVGAGVGAPMGSGLPPATLPVQGSWQGSLYQ